MPVAQSVERIGTFPSILQSHKHYAQHPLRSMLTSEFCRARKGGTLSPTIQKHMEEAMQPDGADLEYVYLGPSRGASPPTTPSRSPLYIAAYSPAPGPSFIQDDTSPYAAVDDWSAAPRLVAAEAPGHRTSRTSNTDATRGPRPKTAGTAASLLCLHIL